MLEKFAIYIKSIIEMFATQSKEINYKTKITCFAINYFVSMYKSANRR